jgi:hypothetical protein
MSSLIALLVLAQAAEVPTDEVKVTPPPTAEEMKAAAKDAAKPPPPTEGAPALIAGFRNGEGFRLLSEDGNWKVRVGLQASTNYQPTFALVPGQETSMNWSQFKVPFARARVDGSVFKKWIRYWFSFEFAQFPPFLLDGYIEAQPHPMFGARLGQMYTPLSRHEYLGPQELVFPEWAIVADYFWTGRDKGLQLFGEGDLIWYYFGFYGGSPPRTTTNTTGNFQLIGRVTVNPMGKMGWAEIPWIMQKDDEGVPFKVSFTVQGSWSKIAPTAVGFNPSAGFFQRTDEPLRHQGIVSGDAQLQWGRFGLMTEFYARQLNPIGMAVQPFWQFGWWGQANFTFYKKCLDLSVRVNWLDPNDKLSNDTFTSGEVQLGWWPFAPYVSLKLRYGVGHQNDPGAAPADQPQLYDIMKLVGTPGGTTHLVTLQANVAF